MSMHAAARQRSASWLWQLGVHRSGAAGCNGWGPIAAGSAGYGGVEGLLVVVAEGLSLRGSLLAKLRVRWA